MMILHYQRRIANDRENISFLGFSTHADLYRLYGICSDVVRSIEKRLVGMMAQEMFEENKALQAEVDALRSLIERWIPHMTSQMHDVDKMREEFEDSLESERIYSMREMNDKEEACEECGWWKPQCKCEDEE